MIYEHAGLPPPVPLSWIRLRANWVAVRQPVQAFPPVIPASEREFWAALCWGIALRCRLAIVILALASQGPVSEHGVTGREENARTKGGVLPVHSFALSLVLLLCHSRLDPESRVAYAQYCVVSRLLSSSPAPPAWIRLRANWAAVRQSVQASPPVIPASERESWAALCVVLGYPNRHTGVHPRTYHPGSRIKCGMTALCAVCAIAPLCTAALSVIPASEPESTKRGFVRSYPRPLPRFAAVGDAARNVSTILACASLLDAGSEAGMTGGKETRKG